jgi:NTP pyrophosphatase (non-canonical NTP hydrolase)
MLGTPSHTRSYGCVYDGVLENEVFVDTPKITVTSLEEYQKLSRRTAMEVRMDHPIVYPTLGLTNEAGEFAGKVKKIFRDKQGVISEEDRQELKKELGDVLWYLAQIATELDLSLEDIASHNLQKLFDRQARNQIQGEGDNR